MASRASLATAGDANASTSGFACPNPVTSHAATSRSPGAPSVPLASRRCSLREPFHSPCGEPESLAPRARTSRYCRALVVTTALRPRHFRICSICSCDQILHGPARQCLAACLGSEAQRISRPTEFRNPRKSQNLVLRPSPSPGESGASVDIAVDNDAQRHYCRYSIDLAIDLAGQLVSRQA